MKKLSWKDIKIKGSPLVLLGDVGKYNPADPESVETMGYYSVVADIDEDFIEELRKANLRGRGGAYFPVWKKWQSVISAEGDEKYVVCNADEGEPGTFKDLVLLGGDPHLVLEGMAIAAKLTGAKKGFVYVRGEYPEVIEITKKAAKVAQDLLKKVASIDFQIEIRSGGGAYVCGEETSLLESLEGKRGMVRLRPPYPVTYGYHGKPTLINNVETFACVSVLAKMGARDFVSLAVDGEGTKLYPLSGDVNEPALVEAPMGISLRTLIEDFGGGVMGGDFKAAMIGGGAAGFIVDSSFLDVPLSQDALAKKGLGLGTGDVIVLNDKVSMSEFLSSVLNFYQNESCGKCYPCRFGTRQLYLMNNLLKAGHREYRDYMLEIAEAMKYLSQCGLGKSVFNPVSTAFRYFEDELVV